MNKFEIKTLGSIEFRYNGKIIPFIANSKRSSKRWILFTYLLFNKDRVVTQDELIEVLWPNGEVKNPANSLKILVYQLRRGMDKMNIVPGDDIILSSNAGYRLNPKHEYVLDLDLLDQIDKRMNMAESDEEKIDLMYEVQKIYTGRFYEGMLDSSWLAAIQNKYIIIYDKIVGTGCKLLFERGQYQEVISACNKAIMLQNYGEEFYYMMIRAYLALGNFESANHIYVRLSEMLLVQYGEKPDPQFEIEFREKSKGNSKVNISFENMQKLFEEEKNSEKALYLSYNEFRAIYKVASRMIFENETDHYLCMFTLAAKKGVKLKEKEKDRIRGILEKVLENGLRKHDIYTRLTINQFVAMMEKTTEKEEKEVADRIIKDFERMADSDKVGIIYKSTKITQK